MYKNYQMKRKRRATQQQQNSLQKYSIESEQIKGWSQDQILAEKNDNITSIHKKNNRLYLKSAKPQCSNYFNHRKNAMTYTFYVDQTHQPSHIDLLKKQIQYLEKDKLYEKFPSSFNNQLLCSQFNAKNIPFRATLGNRKKFIKRSKLNDLIIEGLLNQKQINTQSLKIRPVTCCQKKDLKSIESQRNQNLAIHCKKNNQTPFKKFFLKKRSQKQKINDNSITQVQGRKLTKMMVAMDGNCINHTTSLYNN